MTAARIAVKPTSRVDLMDFLAGTDAFAKAEVAALIDQLGFFGIAAGQSAFRVAP